MINREPKNLKEIIEIIKKLELDNNIVLIGSWCEIFYETLFEDYHANVRTNDIDFYYHEIKIPKISLNFIEEMEDIGYIFKEAPFPPKSKFINGDLEVEFLTRNTRNMNPTEKIESLNLYAECLKECEMFGSPQNVMTCYVEKYDIEMQVPIPVAYCMHKILIHDARKFEKQLKDRQSIYRLIPFIEHDEKYQNDWKRIYQTFSKKEKKRFKKNLLAMQLERLDVI